MSTPEKVYPPAGVVVPVTPPALDISVNDVAGGPPFAVKVKVPEVLAPKLIKLAHAVPPLPNATEPTTSAEIASAFGFIMFFKLLSQNATFRNGRVSKPGVNVNLAK
jgi:hypothetical protein